MERTIITTVLVLVVSFVTLSQGACRKQTDQQAQTAAPPAQSASEPAQAEKTLRQYERDLIGAVMRRDTTVFDRLLADAVTLTEADGKTRDKAQILEAVRSEEYAVKSVNQTEVAVRFYGEVAVVTGLNTVKVEDRAGRDLNGQFRFTHVYAKRQEQWQLLAGQGTLVHQP
jgi:ketosteroid isomerase-like protein